MKATAQTQAGRMAALALVATLACGRDAIDVAWEETASLAVRFAVSSSRSESSLVDFDAPESRTLLSSGWTESQRDSNGLPFVQSLGAESTLSFHLHEARPVRLVFRCRPRPGNASVRSLTLSLNGSTLDVVGLEDRLRTYKANLPAERLLAGDNRLTFIYNRDGAPSEGETRPPVNWFRLGLEGTRSALEPAHAAPGPGVLFVPFGTQIDLPVVVEPGSQLFAERVDFRGGSRSRLEMSLLSDGGHRHVETLGSPRRRAAVALGASETDVALLSLRAESTGAWAAGDGVYLQGSRIRVPVESEATRDEPTNRPNVVVYLVDTLRPDRLSTYGYHRPTAPRLDEFTETATLFEKAVGQSSWTRPSVASLFTGRWPGTHSVIKRRDALSQQAETLAELLQSAGYTTAAVSANPNVSKAFGFAQGFDRFLLMPEASDSTAVNQGVFEWLDQRPTDTPFFLYVQPVDPHNPYLPPESFRRAFAPEAEALYSRIEQNPRQEIWEPDPDLARQLLDLYDGEIAANDASFGALLDRLQELSLLDDMLVIFLSDHGEEFLEHGGWTHGRTLYAETLDFPLVIKLPKQRRGVRVSDMAQHIDIITTIADLLDLEPPATAEGRSLLPLIRSSPDARGREASSPARPAFAHVSLVGGLTTSVVVGRWKLIDSRSRERSESSLYSWPEDPEELQNLSARYPLRTAALKALLEERLAKSIEHLDSEEAALDPELEQRLRALGYL